MQSFLKQIPGIYRIINTLNGKVYIGSTTNLQKRLYDHRYYLNRNKHKNLHLQSAWNKYGESVFVFEVVEVLLVRDKVVIEQLEQHYLDNTHNLYNVALDASLSRLGATMSKESINKACISRAKNESFKGSGRYNAKLNEALVEEIKIGASNGDSLTSLAKKYDKSPGAIFDIVMGNSWKHVRPELNKPPSTSRKLTPKLVLEIRNETVLSRQEMATKYGVQKGQIDRVLRRERWKSVMSSE